VAEWKDEDIATEEYVKDYLANFKEGILNNTAMELTEEEKQNVDTSLEATEEFCMQLLNRKNNKLYMHDLILMAIGYYGGYLCAMDKHGCCEHDHHH